jgi:mannose-6-phosphate isomerase-like protein (cupin superfamily)
MSAKSPEELARLHDAAEALVTTFRYAKPEGIGAGKGRVALARTNHIRGVVQIVKKDGGENNLHYHTNSDSFWLVLKGRIRFYGPDDKVIGEFGPQEGTITPAYSRYWFENAGEGEAEILQVMALHDPRDAASGHTDVSPQRFQINTMEHYDAAKA